jgi:hypothetical protein
MNHFLDEKVSRCGMLQSGSVRFDCTVREKSAVQQVKQKEQEHVVVE